MDVPLTAEHPLRPADWRYQKARDLLLKRGRPRPGQAEDAWRDFWRFLRKLFTCQDDSSRRRLMREAPNLWLALEISGERTSGLRASIEARLLAGQSPAEIAEPTGLTAATVEAFAAIFFDVGDRLASPDLIHAVVFLPPARDGHDQDAERALHAIGYYGGATVLNHVLHTPRQAVNPDTEQRTAEQIAEQLESLLRARIITGTAGPEKLDEKSLQGWARVLTQLETVRRATGDSSPGERAYLKNIKALMDGIPWTLATRQELPEAHKPYQGLATELRADEMLALASGREGPDPKTMRLRILPAGSQPGQPPRP